MSFRLSFSRLKKRVKAQTPHGGAEPERSISDIKPDHSENQENAMGGREDGKLDVFEPERSGVSGGTVRQTDSYLQPEPYVAVVEDGGSADHRVRESGSM